MKVNGQKIILSPGPELTKTLSDQVDRLRDCYRQIESITICLWMEETAGAREKYCEVTAVIPGDELHVTRFSSTHILAATDAMQTIKRRIAGRLKSRKS
jgi:ribosome-associated translation inhibitor RaiA